VFLFLEEIANIGWSGIFPTSTVLGNENWLRQLSIISDALIPG